MTPTTQACWEVSSGPNLHGLIGKLYLKLYSLSRIKIIGPHICFFFYLYTYITKEEKLAGEKIRGQGQPSVMGNRPTEPPLSLS